MDGEISSLKQTPVFEFRAVKRPHGLDLAIIEAIWNGRTGVTRALVDLFSVSLEPDTFQDQFER